LSKITLYDDLQDKYFFKNFMEDTNNWFFGFFSNEKNNAKKAK